MTVGQLLRELENFPTEMAVMIGYEVAKGRQRGALISKSAEFMRSYFVDTRDDWTSPIVAIQSPRQYDEEVALISAVDVFSTYTRKPLRSGFED